MLKYYAFLFLILGIALFYVYVKDPCNRQVRMDFAGQHPSYEILDTGASEGSPETVRCQVSYRKPDAEQVYQDVWLYQYSKRGWEFSKILETRKAREAGEGGDPRRRNDDPGASPRS